VTETILYPEEGPEERGDLIGTGLSRRAQKSYSSVITDDTTRSDRRPERNGERRLIKGEFSLGNLLNEELTGEGGSSGEGLTRGGLPQKADPQY